MNSLTLFSVADAHQVQRKLLREWLTQVFISFFSVVVLLV